METSVHGNLLIVLFFFLDSTSPVKVSHKSSCIFACGWHFVSEVESSISP